MATNDTHEGGDYLRDAAGGPAPDKVGLKLSGVKAWYPNLRKRGEWIDES